MCAALMHIEGVGCSLYYSLCACAVQLRLCKQAGLIKTVSVLVTDLYSAA